MNNLFGYWLTDLNSFFIILSKTNRNQSFSPALTLKLLLSAFPMALAQFWFFFFLILLVAFGIVDHAFLFETLFALPSGHHSLLALLCHRTLFLIHVWLFLISLISQCYSAPSLVLGIFLFSTSTYPRVISSNFMNVNTVLYAENSKMCISSLDFCLEPQAHMSNY